jgi:hypothetical protein
MRTGFVGNVWACVLSTSPKANMERIRRII